MAAETVEVRALLRGPFAFEREPDAERARRRAEFVGTLFCRHRRSLLWYLARLVPNGADAEEVAQEAFLRLLCAERLETDANRARNYLFATATNLARDHYRRRTARGASAHLALDELQIEGADAPPEQVVDIERGRRIVDSALSDLHPRTRQAFLLYVQDELTYAHIALRLGVCKKTIERDIALAVTLCRSRLTRWSEA